VLETLADVFVVNSGVAEAEEGEKAEEEQVGTIEEVD
jgi:hypothetical protein